MVRFDHAGHESSGFSLVEIVVAMLALGVISLALAPLLWMSIQSSQGNRSQTMAMAFADAQVAEFRAVFPTQSDNSKTCAAAQVFVPSVSAPTGSDLVSAAPEVVCPSAYPGSARVTVKIYQGSVTGVPVATVVTEVLVASA